MMIDEALCILNMSASLVLIGRNVKLTLKILRGGGCGSRAITVCWKQ
jgi:hypothetical protein